MLTYTKHVEYSACPSVYTRGQGVGGSVPDTEVISGLHEYVPPELEAAEKSKTLA